MEDSTDVVGVAIDESGATLATHISSDRHWSKRDMLGDWKHGIYDKRYPDGWKATWLDDAVPDDWEGRPALKRAAAPITAIEKLREWMASPAAAVASMPYEMARELASELTAMQAKLDAADKLADAATEVVCDCVPFGDDDFEQLKAALAAYRTLTGA
jgi:hypothetical protein